jgi:hypothetical protein
VAAKRAYYASKDNVSHNRGNQPGDQVRVAGAGGSLWRRSSHSFRLKSPGIPQERSSEVQGDDQAGRPSPGRAGTFTTSGTRARETWKEGKT